MLVNSMEETAKLILKVDSSQVRRATDDLERLRKATGRGATQTQKATSQLSKSFVRLAASIVSVYTAYRSLSAVLRTTAEFEKIDKQLTFITGSAENAAAEIEWLTQVSRDNALVLTKAAGPYARLAESMNLLGLGAEDTRALFEGTANAAATFGLSADELNGVLVAFSQVASKGTVQAEELRNQIGERIPGAFSMAAESMGVTTKELNKMLEMGEVMAIDFLPAFAEAMSKRYSGNLAEVTDTLGGNFRRATTELELFNKTLAAAIGLDDGFNSFLIGSTRFIRELTEGIEDIQRANDIFDMGEIISQVKEARVAIKMFGENEETLRPLNRALDDLSDSFDLMIPKRREREITALGKAFRDQAESVQKLKDEMAALGTEGASGRPLFFIQHDLKIAHAELKAIETTLNHITGAKDKVVPEDRLAGINALGITPGEAVPVRSSQEFDAKEQERIETAFSRLEESLLSEEEAIEASYVKRMHLAEEYALLTGQSVEDIKAKIEKDAKEQERKLQQQRWDTALASFDDFQDNMAILARTGNNDLANIYKAAAIANTTIKTYESATSAYAAMAGIPVIGPALGVAAAAAAVAAGMANVSAISQQQVGNYAQGGFIPGNSLSGDQLTANVNSGEAILNTSQQKNFMDLANGGGGSSKPVIVNVQNFGGGETEVEEVETDKERIINIAVNRAVAKIDNNIRTGAGDTTRALNQRDKRNS